MNKSGIAAAHKTKMANNLSAPSISVRLNLKALVSVDFMLFATLRLEYKPLDVDSLGLGIFYPLKILGCVSELHFSLTDRPGTTHVPDHV
jgi:hypothetical protein